MSDAQFLVHKEKLFRKFNNGLYAGYEEVQVDTKTSPTLQFSGAKMPFELWQQICTFLRWTNAEFKSEAIIQLFYNEDTNQWKAWAMPQYVGTGMTVSQCTDDEVWAEFERTQRVHLQGFEPIGSVHHHCDGSAFQSGTDAADEKNKPGLHITLGHMTRQTMSFHARVSFRQQFYEVNLNQWFDLPASLQEVPDSAKSAVLAALIVEPGVADYPEVWRENCHKKPSTVVHYGSNYPQDNFRDWPRNNGFIPATNKYFKHSFTGLRELAEKRDNAIESMGLVLADILSEYSNVRYNKQENTDKQMEVLREFVVSLDAWADVIDMEEYEDLCRSMATSIDGFHDLVDEYEQSSQTISNISKALAINLSQSFEMDTPDQGMLPNMD